MQRGLSELEYSTLIPFKELASQSYQLIKSNYRLLIYVFAPLILALLPDTRLAITVVQVYFFFVWATYFRKLITPSLSSGMGYASSIFTFTFGIALLVFSLGIPIIRGFTSINADSNSSVLFPLMYYIIGVGMLEEIIKILPLLFIKRFLKKEAKINDWIYLAVMSSLGFATAEGIQYNLSQWLNLTDPAIGFESQVNFSLFGLSLFVLFRLITGPFFHAAWSGILGYFCGYSVNSFYSRNVVIVGVVFASTLHGLYDLFVGQETIMGFLVSIAVAFVSICFLFMYIKRSENVEESIIGEQITVGTPRDTSNPLDLRNNPPR